MDMFEYFVKEYGKLEGYRAICREYPGIGRELIRRAIDGDVNAKGEIERVEYERESRRRSCIIPWMRHEMVKMYEEDLMTMQEIADVFCCSKQNVRNYLRRQGVDTSRKQVYEVRCSMCGEVTKKGRAQIKRSRNLFCSRGCYEEYLGCGGPGYTASRHGQRTARRVVSRYFDLRDEHIVHHKDKNNNNNEISNLMVFGSNGDHLRWHHKMRDEAVNGGKRRVGMNIPVLFDGESVVI